MTPERIAHGAGMAELTGSVEALLNQARELADARGHALAGPSTYFSQWQWQLYATTNSSETSNATTLHAQRPLSTAAS
jgi:hypothetical protein